MFQYSKPIPQEVPREMPLTKHRFHGWDTFFLTFVELNWATQHVAGEVFVFNTLNQYESTHSCGASTKYKWQVRYFTCFSTTVQLLCKFETPTCLIGQAGMHLHSTWVNNTWELLSERADLKSFHRSSHLEHITHTQTLAILVTTELGTEHTHTHQM